MAQASGALAQAFVAPCARNDCRAVWEYLDTLDDAALGAATTAKPKSTAHADTVNQWIAASSWMWWAYALSKKRLKPAAFAIADGSSKRSWGHMTLFGCAALELLLCHRS